MFLDLAHKRMEVYAYAKRFIVLVNGHLVDFPEYERYALSGQIRRAALSVLLNFSEGASRSSSAERKRYYEISRSSLVEVDAAFDVASELGYLKLNYEDLKATILSLYKMLSTLMK